MPEDGIFHNREERLRFPIFDVLRRSSRGRDQCARACIKQSSCTENQQKLKEKKQRENFDILGKGKKNNDGPARPLLLEGLNIKSTVLFLSYMCGQVFITHGENLHSSKHCKLTGF